MSGRGVVNYFQQRKARMVEQQSDGIASSSPGSKYLETAVFGASIRLLTALITLALLVAIPVTVHAAPGDISTKFPVNDENPVAGLPTAEQRDADPLEFGYLLQDLIARAEGAHAKQDWAGSVKYYEALARLVPDRAIGFSRLCWGYANLGEIDVAAANCGKALRLGGARVMDHFRFVSLILQKQNLSTADVSDVEASLVHLRAHVAAKAGVAEPTSSDQGALDALERQTAAKDALGAQTLPVEIAVLGCRLAVRLRQPERIESCLTALGDAGAAPKVRVPFEWAKAVVTKDRARAAVVVANAKSLGFPEAAIESMRAEQARTFGEVGSFATLGSSRWSVLFGALGLLVAFCAVVMWKFIATRRRLHGTVTEA
jgi:hypothetical protein